jgi:hypothetical protein
MTIAFCVQISLVMLNLGVKTEDLIVMKKLGYFGENDDELVRFAGEEIILEPKEDEVVVFKSFFRAGLR